MNIRCPFHPFCTWPYSCIWLRNKIWPTQTKQVLISHTLVSQDSSQIKALKRTKIRDTSKAVRNVVYRTWLIETIVLIWNIEYRKYRKNYIHIKYIYGLKIHFVDNILRWSKDPHSPNLQGWASPSDCLMLNLGHSVGVGLLLWYILQLTPADWVVKWDSPNH